MSAAALYTLAILAVSGAAHYSILQWLLSAFPRLAKHRRRLFVGMVFLVVTTPAARWLSLAFRTSPAPRVLALGMIEVMAVLLGFIPLFLLRVGFDAYAAIQKRDAAPKAPVPEEPTLPAGIAPPAPPPELVTRRQAIERVSGIAILGTSAAVLGWGMVRGRHAFVLEEVAVKIPGLPRALDGYTIVQVSDIHAGLFVGERELAEGLSRLAEVRADLIVATGDLVDIDPHFVPQMAGALGKLTARDGIVAILGNHDYYTGPRAVLAGLKAAGVRTLVDECLHLRPDDGGGFALLGVDDLSGRRMRDGGTAAIDRAIAHAPPDRARILLAHQPRYFHAAQGRVALQLSGHTHGGQINPGFRPANMFMDYVSGRYEAAGSTLYVNRGFGVAGPPARVGAPPEVTKIVLVAG